ncbi:uncharacterized protein C2orf92 homolog isoform X5 [Bos taurus]|uniref:uncharacterized protein C2orf92 homolog isoform X5 n=1 Tax=Bos taurus TaxID=9913 RepID=UPI000383F7D4|nr:uncharacterized protein C2orf92 homolog isoform X5 [Bos taurus]
MAKKREAEALFFVLFLDYWQGSNAESSSNSKILDKGLAKLFDEILLQVFSKVPLEETRRTADRSITKRDMQESYPSQKSSRETDFALSSNKRDEHLAKLFENNPADDQNHNPPHVENISQTLRRSSDHIAEEQRDQESSLFNRDVSDTQSTTINKGTLQEAVSPDIPSRGMPCSQLLQFLQKNIIIAAVSVVGIVTATGLLLLALVMYIRKKQSLRSPADITYNIFIMNGKTWWQKSQDKKTKKHAGKQKRLKLNAGI